MVLAHDPTQNRILAGLSPADYGHLAPALELVNFQVGEVIYEPGLCITHLYFPLDCIIARLYELDTCASMQTSVTGNEGMVGISYLLASESASARTAPLKGRRACAATASKLNVPAATIGRIFIEPP